MTSRFDLEELGDDLDALETSFADTRSMARAFDVELLRMRESLTLTNAEVGTFSRSVGRGLRNAFDDLVFEGAKLSDVLKDVAQSISNAAYNAAMRPVQNQLGGLVAGGIEGLISSVVPFANGGAFTQGRVMPFATGGIVSGPVAFPMRGGTGLMGEAGPEAIMPLTRGADGRLGVRSEGGGRSVNITMNITTPDVQGFQRSQSQIAANMSRLMARGRRNL
ncbi:phage tail tape measure protein [Actibacterium pelagium]|uniref:Tail protein n=1 Tax=Actibacterium pelagium TaxID=2029103 RepID=A0A917ABW2_9RHOB|nr:phage tail tape measure protein [Actibacterium pelagium]GGE40617.1 tail protein [Actibacterium pelagium]